MGYPKLQQVLRILQLIGLSQATIFFSSSQDNQRAKLPDTTCPCIRLDQCPNAVFSSTQKDASLGTSPPCEINGFVRCCDVPSRNVIGPRFAEQSNSYSTYVNEKNVPAEEDELLTAETRYRENLMLPEGIVVPLPFVYPEYVDPRKAVKIEEDEVTTETAKTKTLPPGIVAPPIGFVYPEYLDKITLKNEEERKESTGGNVDLRDPSKRVGMTILENVRDAISSEKITNEDLPGKASRERIVKTEVARENPVQRLPEGVTPPPIGFEYPEYVDLRKNVGTAVESKRNDGFEFPQTRMMSRMNFGSRNSGMANATTGQIKSSIGSAPSAKILPFDLRMPLLFGLPLFINDITKKRALQNGNQSHSSNVGRSWSYHQRQRLPVDDVKVTKISRQDSTARKLPSNQFSHLSSTLRSSLPVSEQSDQLRRLRVLRPDVDDRKTFSRNDNANYTTDRAIFGNMMERRSKVLSTDRTMKTVSVEDSDIPEETDVFRVKATIGRAQDPRLDLPADLGSTMSTAGSFESLKERDSSGLSLVPLAKSVPVTIRRGKQMQISRNQESLGSHDRYQLQRESASANRLRVPDSPELSNYPKKHERDLQNATDGFKNINHALMVISESVSREDFPKKEEVTNSADIVAEKSRDNVTPIPDVDRSTNIIHVPPVLHSISSSKSGQISDPALLVTGNLDETLKNHSHHSFQEKETLVTTEKVITLANLLAGISHHDVDDPEVKKTLSTLNEEKVQFGSRVAAKFTNVGSTVGKESFARERLPSETFTLEEASVHPKDTVVTKLMSDAVVPIDGRPTSSKVGNYSRLLALYGDAARKRNFRGKSFTQIDPDLEVTTTSGEFLRNVFKNVSTERTVGPFRRTVLKRRPTIGKDVVEEARTEGRITNLKKIDNEARLVNGNDDYHHDNNNNNYSDSITHLNLVKKDREDVSSIMTTISPETQLMSEVLKIQTMNKDLEFAVEATSKESSLPIEDVTLNRIVETREDVASKSAKVPQKMTLDGQENYARQFRTRNTSRKNFFGSKQNAIIGSGNRELSNGTNNGRYVVRRRQRPNRKSATSTESPIETLESLETTKTPLRRSSRILARRKTLLDQETNDLNVHDRQANFPPRGSTRQRNLRMTKSKREKGETPRTKMTIENEDESLLPVDMEQIDGSRLSSVIDSTTFQISSDKVGTRESETSPTSLTLKATILKIDNARFDSTSSDGPGGQTEISGVADVVENSGSFKRNFDGGSENQMAKKSLGGETSTLISIVRDGVILTDEEIERLKLSDSGMEKNGTGGPELREVVVDEFVPVLDSNSSTSTSGRISGLEVAGTSEAEKVKDETSKADDDGRGLNEDSGSSRLSDSTILSFGTTTERILVEDVDEASKDSKGSGNNKYSEAEKKSNSDNVQYLSEDREVVALEKSDTDHLKRLLKEEEEKKLGGSSDIVAETITMKKLTNDTSDGNYTDGNSKIKIMSGIEDNLENSGLVEKEELTMNQFNRSSISGETEKMITDRNNRSSSKSWRPKNPAARKDYLRNRSLDISS